MKGDWGFGVVRTYIEFVVGLVDHGGREGGRR